MKHVAACSFGKDSVATVILAKEHNEPLDEVVYCEVMFDDQISGEVPEHRDFIYEKEKDVRRLRIPRNAEKGRNLRCRGTARIYGRADETADTV